MKKSTLLKLLVSLALLGWLVWQQDLTSTWAQLKAMDLGWFALAASSFWLLHFLVAYRWLELLKPLGFDASLWTVFKTIMLACFAGLVLPGALGGDVVRVFTLAKTCNKPKRLVFLSIAAERLGGLLGLVLLITALAYTPSAASLDPAIKSGLLTLCAACVGALIAVNVLPPKRLAGFLKPLEGVALLRGKTTGLSDAMARWLTEAERYWKDIPYFVWSITLVVAIQVAVIGIHWLLAQAFQMEVAIEYLGITYGVAMLASVLPISMSGAGVREGVYVVMLKQAGVPGEVAFGFSIAWFLTMTLLSLSGGLFLIQDSARELFEKATHEADDAPA